MKPIFKPKIIIPLILAVLIAGISILGVVYVNDYYRPTSDALDAMNSTPADAAIQVTVTVQDDGVTVFVPEAPMAGFIFYPGGKVEHTAYAPLMQALAERGVLCALVEMPLRLAVLDANAAEGLVTELRTAYPGATEWYIGGHSLGGSMAASYAATHSDELTGLVLLAAYSTADLTSCDLRVLSLLGSEDTVLNHDKYDKNRQNLPDGFTECILEGGNHAGFGAYGPQDGDGISTMPVGEQIEQSADHIAIFIQARS